MKTFSGGYSFKRFKGQPCEQLETMEVPKKVVIPLSQGFGNPPSLLVKEGDTVLAGQIIARDDQSVSSPAHATISGRVTAVEKKNYFNRETIMVTIEGDGNGSFQKLPGFSPQWEKLPPEEIEDLIYFSGASSLDRQGIPTRHRSSIIPPSEVEDLIIHGIGSEAYNLSLGVLLKGKNLFNFVEGMKILKRIMPQARIYLAIDRQKKSLIDRIRKLTIHLDNFDLYPVRVKYPQGYDEVLIPTLLGKKFPYGYSAANIGVIVLRLRTVLHVFEAVTAGKPLIERTLILGGPGFKNPRHLVVRVGTPLERVLKEELREIPCRIILDSLLTGVELKDFSLPLGRLALRLIALPENPEREFLSFARFGWRRDSYSRAFLSAWIPSRKTADTNRHGEERPCIQCGYCLEVCPVGIIPALLDRYSRLAINETLMRYGIFNCIDCNLCSYVCPSKIPLAKNLKEAKAKLIDIGCDHSLCILPKFDLIGLEEYKGVKALR